MKRPESPIPLLLGLFFLSGAASLMYEVLWIRQLSLVFGATTYAISAVFAAFMGGLALGSRLGGLLADKLNTPRKLCSAFAALEGAVGLYGIFFPLLIRHVDEWAMTSHFGGSAFGSDLVWKFALSSALLLVPTTCMGATFPVLSRLAPAGGSDVSWFGGLYGINTLGAASGAALCGFALIPAAGVTATLRIAAALNLIVAGTAVALGQKWSASLGEQGTETLPLESPTAPENHWAWFGTAAFLGGGASLFLEVAWSRALHLVLGNSTYALSTVLVTFLLGLALGGVLCSRLIRKGQPLDTTVTALLAATALAILATGGLLGTAPLLFVQGFKLLGPSFEALTVLEASIAGMIMLPATILMGLVFPMLLALSASSVRLFGNRIGHLYSLNTVGSILGSVLCGFWFLQRFGSETAIKTAAAAYLGTAVLLTLGLKGWAVKRRASYALFPTLAFGGLWLGSSTWDPHIMTSGVYLYADALKEGFPREDLLFYEEGVHCAVSVREANGIRSLRIDGKTDGSNGKDMGTQVLLGAVPATVAPAKDSIFVLGWGTGVTCGAALAFQPKRIDCVEIEPAVVKASGLFREENRQALEDPRLHLHLEDARQFLRRTSRQFDVMISEPSNPWIRGASNCFTVEMYRLMERALAPKGLVCQWVQLYQLRPDDLAMILTTFGTVFPHFKIFLGSIGDVLVVGGREPWTLNLDRMEQRLSVPKVREMLQTLDITSPESLVGLLVVSSDDLKERLARAPVNTDNRPLLEFTAARNFFLRTHEENLQWLASAEQALPVLTAKAPERLYKGYEALFYIESQRQNTALMIKALEAAAKAWPEDPDGNYLQGVLAMGAGDAETAKAKFLQDTVDQPAKARSWVNLALLSLKEGNRPQAKEFVEKARTAEPSAAGVDEIATQMEE